ncbi:MAG: DUF2961 domain-containing protein [Sedimentisphaerales bacterium]|nr:DUF2961 domain-containing protein [Sedimentisphaerales bacterium]
MSMPPLERFSPNPGHTARSAKACPDRTINGFLFRNSWDSSNLKFIQKKLFPSIFISCFLYRSDHLKCLYRILSCQGTYGYFLLVLPSLHGTGTEDFFNFAWGLSHADPLPMHGITLQAIEESSFTTKIHKAPRTPKPPDLTIRPFQ